MQPYSLNKAPNGNPIKIFDLGQESVNIFDTLNEFVERVTDCGSVDYHLGRDLFNEIVTDVVRLLNIPPSEAIEQCKRVPRGETFRDMVVLFGIREIDDIKLSCYESALCIYKKLREQIGVTMGTYYAAEFVGLDHVAIRLNPISPLI